MLLQAPPRAPRFVLAVGRFTAARRRCCDSTPHRLACVRRTLRACVCLPLLRYGLDLVKGEVRNNLEAGVLEPAMGKIKILQVRTRADPPRVWVRDDGR